MEIQNQVGHRLRGDLSRLHNVLDAAASQGIRSLGPVADRVCEAFDLRDGRGRCQRASCRKALADVSRLRLILEGERVFEAGDGATFTPTGQVGLRLDGGDAETGTGVEVGAGIRYTAGALTIEGQVRALVAHEESGFEEWGASGAIRVAPDASGRGLSLTLAPVWGNAAGGAQRLWSARDATVLAVGEDAEAEGRLDAELSYGVGLRRVPGVLTPYAGLSVADGGGRSWRSGARWTIAPGAALGLEATRAEAANDNAMEHGVILRGSFRW